MPARAGAERIPEDLRVHVRMPVDEARRNHRTLGVDDFFGGFIQLANGGNLAAGDSHVGAKAGRPGAIDNLGITNDKIQRHFCSPSGSRAVEGHELQFVETTILAKGFSLACNTKVAAIFHWTVIRTRTDDRSASWTIDGERRLFSFSTATGGKT